MEHTSKRWELTLDRREGVGDLRGVRHIAEQRQNPRPVAAVLDLISAVFHTNRSGAPTTTSSGIHQAAGITTFVLVALSVFFLIPLLGDSNFGLTQRLFVASWLSWLIATGAAARRAADLDSAFVTGRRRRSALAVHCGEQL